MILTLADPPSPVPPEGLVRMAVDAWMRRGRNMILVGVVVGLVFGAWSCMAGVATGVGHSEHRRSGQPVERGVGDVTLSHRGHTFVGTPPAAFVSTSEHRDGEPAALDRAGQSHPGMACVIEVSLREPEHRIIHTMDSLEAVPTPPPCEHCSGPEPPIPR